MPPSPSTPEPEPAAAANPVPAPPPAPSSSSLFRSRPASLLPPPPTASLLPPAAAASLASSNAEGPGLTSHGQATPTSSPPSDKPAAKRRSVTKELRDEVTELCHDGVKTISGVVHHVLTFRNKAERDAGVWMADTEQAARIAEPAAELVLTHVPDAWLKTTFVQGLRLLFGVGNYVEDHLATKADLRFNPPQVIPGKALTSDQAA